MHGNCNAQWYLLRKIKLRTWFNQRSWRVFRKTKYVVLGCKFRILYARLLSVIFRWIDLYFSNICNLILKSILLFVPQVDESYGFIHYINMTCVGSTLLISGAHTTPYDCFKLCDATEGCNVFQFSSLVNQCIVMEDCIGALTSNDTFDTYGNRKFNK